MIDSDKIYITDPKHELMYIVRLSYTGLDHEFYKKWRSPHPGQEIIDEFVHEAAESVVLQYFKEVKQ